MIFNLKAKILCFKLSNTNINEVDQSLAWVNYQINVLKYTELGFIDLILYRVVPFYPIINFLCQKKIWWTHFKRKDSRVVKLLPYLLMEMIAFQCLTCSRTTQGYIRVQSLQVKNRWKIVFFGNIKNNSMRWIKMVGQ